MIGQITLEKPEETKKEQSILHEPVMLREVLDNLNPKPGQVFVDGTLGLGGHSREILKRISPQGRLIGFDRDQQSMEIAKNNLAAFNQQCHFVHDDFRNFDKALGKLGIKDVDGILLDLGVSSLQLDDPQRGFSFRFNSPLDMRMDQKSFISAFDLINSLSEKEISSILKNFGEERWHQRIARGITLERVKHPIETTEQLIEVILKATPYRSHHDKIHPATRTFQAFRIAVNRELESLEIVLTKCLSLLKVGGRIVVIAFHSLEDRIVKNQFRAWVAQGHAKSLTKKPLRPADEESRSNPRARSAKLRVAERIA